MNKAIYILTVFLSSTLSLFGQSASPVNSNIEFTHAEACLTRPELTSDDLIAYQNRAQQKVAEYYQYLKVMSDKDLNSNVRDKALQMATDQFNVPIDSLRNLEINQTLLICRSNQEFKTIDSLETVQPLNLIGSGLCSGTMKVQYHYNDPKSISTEFIRIHLIKKEKVFGSEKRIIWELFLGEIK